MARLRAGSELWPRARRRCRRVRGQRQYPRVMKPALSRVPKNASATGRGHLLARDTA
jgi:hypothetical protein